MDGISQQKWLFLNARMKQLGIKESDLSESFIRSSGPGGQNANKVATCVALEHTPSGIQVKCDTYRFQVINRYQARVVLFKKIEEQKKNQLAAKRHAMEKERRKNRKKPRSLKEKILESKRYRSDKKVLRKKFDQRNFDE
jgi:protein subunit release factor B